MTIDLPQDVAASLDAEEHRQLLIASVLSDIVAENPPPSDLPGLVRARLGDLEATPAIECHIRVLRIEREIRADFYRNRMSNGRNPSL